MRLLPDALARRLVWAVAFALISPLAFGVSPPPESLELPEVVVRSIDRVRLEARRQGVLALEPPRTAQTPVRIDVPIDVLPSPELREAPPVQSPGCAYRNPVTGAVARATKGPEALYKTALERLSRERLDEAAYYLARLRSDHPEHPNADDAAFWLGEIDRRKGRTEEALAFLRLVHGTYAQEAAYRLAWLLEAEGRSSEAMEVWSELAGDSAGPHRPEALYRVGAGRLATADAKGAVDALEEALSVEASGEPVDPEVRVATLLALALARRETGDARGAEDLLTRLLLERPDHPSAPAAQLALGWALLDQEKAREAALRFQWVLDASPSDDLTVRALYGRLRAYIDLGQEAEATDVLSAVEADAPTGPWLGWARADLGWLTFREQRYDEALEWYRSAAKVWVGPGEDVPQYMAAECLYLTGRYPEASQTYQALASESPLRPAALHRAGLCALLGGDSPGAVELFEAVVRQYPSYAEADRVWAWLGEARFRMGRHDEALEAFRRVPEGSPAYPQALYGLAWIAFEAERWDEAADLFQRLLRRYPDDPNRDEAALTLALSHFNRREVRLALDTLDRLEDPGASPYYRSAARYHRGWMLARSGRETVGREALEGLLKEEPRGPFAARAHQTLAWLDYAQGRYADALARFEAVIDVAPGGEVEREARQKRADSLYNLGRYEEALEAYRSLGESPEARYGQALCLHRLGRTPDLAEAADVFASRYPEDPRAVDLLFALAEARSAAGDPAGAAQAYQRAAQFDQGGARSAEASLEGARNLLQAGDETGAIAELETLTSRPGPVGLAALKELARVLDDRGGPEEAQAAWDRLAERTDGEDRSRALRSAGHWARTSLDLDGARQRVEAALESCPPEAALLHQALLGDLGEILLLQGSPQKAVTPLAQATEMGTSSEGLRAFLTLARAQQAAGQDQESLETYLRIGYLYAVSEPQVAEALLHAGQLFEEGDRPDRARAVYEKVASEAPENWASQARAHLDRLASPTAGERD